MKKCAFLFYPDILFVSIYPKWVVAQVRQREGEKEGESEVKAFHNIIYYNLLETADIFTCLCPSTWPVSDGKERNHLVCMRNTWKDVHQIVSMLILGRRVGIWKILNFLFILLLIIYYFYNKHILVLQSGATVKLLQVELCPPKISIEVLTHGTSECELIRK